MRRRAARARMRGARPGFRPPIRCGSTPARWWRRSSPRGSGICGLARGADVARAWEEALARWLDAGLIEPGAAERIRAFEARRGDGTRWPVRLAVGLGGLLLSAGILLFVAAHWDAIGPAARFVLLLG